MNITILTYLVNGNIFLRITVDGHARRKLMSTRRQALLEPRCGAHQPTERQAQNDSRHLPKGIAHRQDPKRGGGCATPHGIFNNQSVRQYDSTTVPRYVYIQYI